MTQPDDQSAGGGGPAPADTIVSHEEVATMLGIAPSAVRSTLRRNGITEVRGYPRVAVEALRARRASRGTEGPTAP